jgi:hypothetical protein
MLRGLNLKKEHDIQMSVQRGRPTLKHRTEALNACGQYARWQRNCARPLYYPNRHTISSVSDFARLPAS